MTPNTPSILSSGNSVTSVGWEQLATPLLWARTASRGDYLAPRHIQRLSRAVMDTITGTGGVRRLMVMLPPRHGKSEFCSKYLPSWYLGVFPSRRIILSSYEATFAASWGRKSRNLLEQYGQLFGAKVASSPSSADQWDIAGHSGGMVTAGAGGSITGRGADLLLVDDPLKNAEEANSATTRNRIWDWWQSTAYTRLEPDGACIVIQTRWHEDDLCGKLLAEAADGGEQWRVLKMPAIGSDGSALWPERFSTERLDQIRRSVGEYYWNALYQQEPTPREGTLFKVSKLQVVSESELPSNLKAVRAWDEAATEGDGDYTAGVKMATDGNGRFFVLDVRRGQWATDERDAMIRQTAGIDGKACRIRIPEDPGAAGKSMAAAQLRMLAGYTVKAVRVTGDKITRADPYSSQVNAGNVWIVEGPWNRDYVEELRQFPRGSNDDQVDASADAFIELLAKRQFTVGV